MSAGLQLRNKGDVLELVLDRPAVRNALDEELIAALTHALREDALAPSVRFVVLRAEGKAFCAGADLAYMQRMAQADDATNLADAARLAALFEAITTCARPVVVAVNGAAMGGGVGLVVAADFALAADTARFGFTEVRLGIVPGVISPFVLRRVSPAVARRLFLTGEVFGAEAALGMGLIDEVCAAEALDARVQDTLGRLRAGGPGAQTATKRLVDAIASLPLHEAVQQTPAHIARQRATDEAREGMRAFFEKRPPSWAPTSPDAQGRA